MRTVVALAVVCALLASTLAQMGEDESLSTYPNEDFIKTNMLPGGPSPSDRNDNLHMVQYNSRELPELSSGVIGTVPYNESIFLSGLYRSASTGSQSFVTRVRIPNYAMFRINRTDDATTQLMNRAFYFNYTKALWEETIDTPLYYIRQVMGVHAHYSRTFFHAIRVTRKTGLTGRGSALLSLSTHHARLLEDSKFTEDLNTNSLVEQIAQSEDVTGVQRKFSVNGAGDTSDSEIIVYSNAPQAKNPAQNFVNLQFNFVANQVSAEDMFVQTVGFNREQRAVLDEYKQVQRSLTDFNTLMTQHTQAWEKRFKAGSIEVEGTGTNYAKMRRMIKSTLYQLYSQFPFADRYGVTNGGTSTTPVEDLAFNGVSACGLGRGGNSTKTARIDFAGHVTPDQELFVFQPLAMLQPDLARQILYYRTRQIQSNPPVPFESARSGLAVDPVWCTHCPQQAHYPSGLLALAARHFHAITRDQAWVDLAQRGGLEILERVARYYDPKIQRNSTRVGDYYSIIQACGPDELHQTQTNNLMTNALAALSIHYWTYLKCISNKQRDAAQDTLLDHARRLAFAFNPVSQTNEQFEGFDTGSVDKMISHSDALLAYFPASFNMSGRWLEAALPKRLQNDIQKYGDKFSSSSGLNGGVPATAQALKAILHMQIGTSGELNSGLSEFEQLKNNYASTPFHVWRNITERYDASAAGHLGTAASFIGTLLFGFGGLRLRTTRLDILRPSLPTDITALHFKGLHFFGGEFDYSVTQDRVRFASAGGSAFKTTMLFYDRTLHQYQPFSGSAEHQIPAQVSYPSMDWTSSQAIYSIVSETNFHCAIDDQNYNSHNPYYWAGASANNASLLAILLAAIVAIFAMNQRHL